MENEEDEDYIPIEPKNYNYKAKEDLLLYLDDEINIFNKVYIFPYKVNTNSLEPFLNFLLIKFGKTLQFPEISIFKDFDQTELINYSKTILFGLCNLIDLDKFNETIIFNGFYKYENNLYLFFDVTNCNIKTYDIYSNNKLWFCILDEIVNHKKICNFKINENTISLFTSNQKLCFLVDDNNNNYETPIVSFIGTTKEKVNFKYNFGESSQNKNAILGPYFYFTNFSNSFKNQNIGVQINKINNINTFNDCIIRFAIFLGNVKYIENNQNDNMDESEIKKQRLLDESLDQNFERLTMRITDFDGLWSRNFNSVYLGQLELDNGIYLQNTPIIVVKEYEQQCPLSYHYVNKKTIEEEESWTIV